MFTKLKLSLVAFLCAVCLVFTSSSHAGPAWMGKLSKSFGTVSKTTRAVKQLKSVNRISPAFKAATTKGTLGKAFSHAKLNRWKSVTHPSGNITNYTNKVAADARFKPLGYRFESRQLQTPSQQLYKTTSIYDPMTKKVVESSNSRMGSYLKGSFGTAAKAR